MRTAPLFILVAALCIYAWKDWFRSLCGLIILTAVVMRHEFPTSLAGIQGLNLWNLLLVNVILAWLANRTREGLRWDMPRDIGVLLILWLCVLLLAFMLMVADRDRLRLSLTNLISDDLVNTIKWVVPSLLVFDGCRTRRRARMVLTSILFVFILFILQISSAIAPKAVLQEGNSEARMRLDSETGLSPNGAGKMMSGVPWAMLAAIPLLKKRRHRFLMIAMCAGGIYAVALAGSRSGFIACFATLLLLCLLRWRRYLPVLPLVVIVASIVLPGAAARMLSGFGETDVAGEDVANTLEITSGRNEIWKAVIPRILESPVWGHGRRAMPRIGVTQQLVNEHGEYSGLAVHHPHCAYLELLLESGLIGLVIVMGLHLRIWIYAVRLFAARGDPIYTVTGGVALALLTGHLVAHLGGQSFYPREIDICLWCAIGLMLRVHVEERSLAAQVGDMSYQYAYRQGQHTFSGIPLGGSYS